MPTGERCPACADLVRLMPEEPLRLPERPNLRHLKDQAKDLLRAGGAPSLTAAQFDIARRYGFASWMKLKEHVDQVGEDGWFADAMQALDLPRVQELVKRNPSCSGSVPMQSRRSRAWRAVMMTRYGPPCGYAWRSGSSLMAVPTASTMAAHSAGPPITMISPWPSCCCAMARICICVTH